MDRIEAKRRYDTQRYAAARRGIGWEITFEEWLAWWGEDVAQRGTHSGQLSMQRIADSGPYRLDNIRKGYPITNGQTRSRVYRNRQTEDAYKAHQAALDASPGNAPSHDEEEIEEDAAWLYQNLARPTSVWDRY